MKKYSYKIFIPGGNKTALVLGSGDLEQNKPLRKEIEQAIFSKHENDPDGKVEQVGFVDEFTPRLLMAGGEFCGNAMRSAVMHYLDGCEGTIEITVSGTNQRLLAGINQSGEVFAQMPLLDKVEDAINCVKGGLYWVTIEGISHLVVPQLQSTPYLKDIYACDGEDKQIEIAVSFLSKTIAQNILPIGEAYGAIFLEQVTDTLKMHPFVQVGVAAEDNKPHYETACGSGAICVGLVSALFRGKDALLGQTLSLPILQPSGEVIKAEIQCDKTGKITGKISGFVISKGTYELGCAASD